MIEFERRFSDEAACRSYLFQLRWPEGFRCPRCGHSDAWKTRRDLFTCSRCGFETTVTAGTIFHRSRKPLCLWFRAMWHIMSQKYGANALGLQRVLSLGSYHTAWEWLHKLRRVMVRPGRERLSGTVEVDETYVGGEKSGKRGRGAAGKTLVMVAVEDKGTEERKEMGRIRLHRVPNASTKSLESFIETNIESGSTVRTDAWGGYSQIEKKGYVHCIARNTASVGEDALNLDNLIIALFKRWLLGTYQGAVKPAHLDYYLDEYTFRFNRRKSNSRGKLFYRLMQQAVTTAPVFGKNIEGGNPMPEHNI